MKYRIDPKSGNKLSALAFGGMRIGGDERRAEELIARAIELGVNYFDTAYIYPGNEALLGKILSKGYRDKVYLATKLPHYLAKKREDMERMFATQLERLKTDYIDYYLIHMLNDPKDWQRVVDLGIIDWINEKKAAGQIRHIGFSFHGGKDAFVQIVDMYPWEMCMIQYNYLDEHNQAGKSGLQYAAGKGIPVMIMEPLRGGKLVSGLPKAVYEAFNASEVKRTPAEWALRWVLNHPEVTTVLSGMSSMAMLEENARIASETDAGSLTKQDHARYAAAKQAILAATRVPCTGCAYCMPCPKGVDIPQCFSMLNDVSIEGKLMTRVHYALRLGHQNAGQCVGCGKCESHCPQKIAIRQELKAVQKALEGPIYKPMRAVVRKVMNKR